MSNQLKLISREDAKASGQDKYFTGKKCKRGHIAERRVSNSICLECAKSVYKPAYTEKYRTSENTFLWQFNSRRQAAIRNGIPFTITFEQLEQPEFCPVLGVRLNYGCSKDRSLKKNGLSGRDTDKATIDKLDPTKGYIPGNVFVISWRANKLKSDMTIEELQKILDYMKRNKENDTTV